MTNKEEIIHDYYANGKVLTFLVGKKPVLKNWPQNIPDQSEVLKYDGNLGCVIDKDLMVIDVDVKNNGQISYKKICKDLNLKFIKTVNTPSGGFHIYCNIPEGWQGKKFRKNLNNKYPGVDFLTKGSQCVIPGSKTEKGSYEWDDPVQGFFLQDAPISLLKLLSCDSENLATYDMEILPNITGNSTVPIEKVEAMLSKLDPDMGYPHWCNVGMALNSWDPIEGLKLWQNWSKKGKDYKEHECEKKWRSFRPDGGVTLGTVSYMAAEVEKNTEEELVRSFIRRINDTRKEEVVIFNIANEIKESNISSANRSRLMRSIIEWHKDHDKPRPTTPELRDRLFKTQKVSFGEVTILAPKPAWCEEWCYVSGMGSYFNFDTRQPHKTESFNVINGQYVPCSSGNIKQSASKYVADNGFIEDVHSMGYFPGIKDKVVTMDGVRYVNRFNYDTIPQPAKEFTEDGLKAVELIKDHFNFLCNKEENGKILLQWLAHQIQYPGKKILWAPLIQSIQGAGKSFITQLLSHCLSDANVGVVNPVQVVSDFNGWATNTAVTVFEELKIKGKSRYEAMNAIKPLITDRVIQINEKGIKQYKTLNTTNYIGFTNYKDSLPLDDSDRRFWVIFTEVESIEEMELKVGASSSVYFSKLFKTLKYSDQIIKWLLEYEISESFKSLNRAPLTDYKKLMITADEGNIEGLDELRLLISEGGKWYDKNVISSAELFTEFEFRSHVSLNSRSKNHLLQKLGYMQLPSLVKISSEPRRIWAKKFMTSDEVREYFKKRHKEGDLNDL